MEIRTIYDLVLDYKKPFLEHLLLKDCKKTTIDRFSNKIDYFSDFLSIYEKNITIDNFSSMHINSFLTYTKDRILKSKSILKKSRKGLKRKEIVSHWTLKSYITALKCFFSFISDNNNDLLDFSKVFSKIIKIKENTEIERFTLAEREKIQSVLEKESQEALKKGNLQQIRNILALNILFYTGLRVSEVLQINKGDFREHDERFFSIDIKGKGGKVRKTFILKEIVIEFLDLIPEDKKIINVEYVSFYQKINRFLARCNISYQKSGCHIFRHSFGDFLVSKGVDLKIIQELLGHQNISTTAKFYTRAGDDVKTKSLKAVFG
ncbi:tyrosine-type recombinase/integrase [Helicobacter anseris]|nr:tyrosine-type recombinase/integrase [Helicobacter anseris]